MRWGLFARSAELEPPGRLAGDVKGPPGAGQFERVVHSGTAGARFAALVQRSECMRGWGDAHVSGPLGSCWGVGAAHLSGCKGAAGSGDGSRERASEPPRPGRFIRSAEQVPSGFRRRVGVSPRGASTLRPARTAGGAGWGSGTFTGGSVWRQDSTSRRSISIGSASPWIPSESWHRRWRCPPECPGEALARAWRAGPAWERSDR